MTVVLSDGRRLRLEPRWFGKGWALVDERDALLLKIVKKSASELSDEELETGRVNGQKGWRFTWAPTRWPDEWVVTPTRSMDLGQIVGIVEMLRDHVKRARRAVGV